MANTIITKNSSTASAVPAAGSLTQGELAVNVTDKKLYTKNASGTVVEITPSVALYANSAGNGGVTSVNGQTGAVTLSTGGVTSLNGQTGAITNTSFDAIGDIIKAAPPYNAWGNYTPSSTIAGSSLRVSSGSNNSYSNVNPVRSFTDIIGYSYQGFHPGTTGTWRALGHSTTYYQPIDGIGGATSYMNIWVRIS